MSLTVTLAAIGLVVDFGWAYWRKEAAATAASSAANAAVIAANAASNWLCGTGTNYWNCSSTAYGCAAAPTNPPASNLDNGCLYAKQNGFLNTGRQSVTMTSGTGTPPAVPGITASYWVTVTVTENIPTLFSAAINQQWMKVASQATAGIFAGPAGGCIFILDPTDAGSLYMNGNTTLNSNCGIYVNSSSAAALSMVGTGSITTTGHAKTNVVGGVSLNPNDTITPAAVTGVAATPDPFAAQMPVAPAAGACQDGTTRAQYTGSKTTTIPQGTYCYLVSQGSSGSLILTSGTYVLQGGLTVGGTASLSATGPVTLYIPNGGISMAGGTNVNLSAPTSGAYQGILIWQPSSNNTNPATIVGGATQGLNGLIYMPTTQVTYTGNSAATTATFVVYTLSLKGTVDISNPATTPWASLGPKGVYGF